MMCYWEVVVIGEKESFQKFGWYALIQYDVGENLHWLAGDYS